MTISIGQTTYSLYPALAAPGQLGDMTDNHIVNFQAADTINPGRLLELASDGVSAQEIQRTSANTNPLTLTGILGFSVLKTMKEGVGNSNVVGTAGGAQFLAGASVPVLRKGCMFAEWSGTTQTAFAVPNVYHSSTIALNRGKLTDATAASTTGAEINPAPSSITTVAKLTGSGNIALIEVNLPAA